jgi:hypothetical protein
VRCWVNRRLSRRDVNEPHGHGIANSTPQHTSSKFQHAHLHHDNSQTAIAGVSASFTPAVASASAVILSRAAPSHLSVFASHAVSQPHRELSVPFFSAHSLLHHYTHFTRPFQHLNLLSLTSAFPTDGSLVRPGPLIDLPAAAR